jgi:hypothetical protein
MMQHNRHESGANFFAPYRIGWGVISHHSASTGNGVHIERNCGQVACLTCVQRSVQSLDGGGREQAQ